jgi:hypothetical protein
MALNTLSALEETTHDLLSVCDAATIESLRLHPVNQEKDVIVSLTKGQKCVSTNRPRKPGVRDRA